VSGTSLTWPMISATGFFSNANDKG
jgi:hypothetical protein